MKKRRVCPKQDKIAHHLRDAIVNRVYAPGDQLPVLMELAKRHKTSTATVQKVLHHLKAEGFLDSHGMRGTRVVKRPPHSFHYALGFIRERSASLFSISIEKAAEAIFRHDQREIKSFYNLGQYTVSDDYVDLTQRIANRRLAGIIIITSPELLMNTPIIRQDKVPCVSISAYPARIPCISVDGEAFREKALDYFVRRGRKRVAVIANPEGARLHPWRKQILAKGLHTDAAWTMAICAEHPEVAQNCVQLLMARSSSERPDALLIDDDHLVEHATAGLLAAGVNTPDEADVVAHCNFPCKPVALVPVKWLGFDSRVLVRAAEGMLDRMRQGERPRDRIMVSPHFEEELCSENPV